MAEPPDTCPRDTVLFGDVTLLDLIVDGSNAALVFSMSYRFNAGPDDSGAGTALVRIICGAETDQITINGELGRFAEHVYTHVRTRLCRHSIPQSRSLREWALTRGPMFIGPI
jgi:hypothetical protein